MHKKYLPLVLTVALSAGISAGTAADEAYDDLYNTLDASLDAGGDFMAAAESAEESVVSVEEVEIAQPASGSSGSNSSDASSGSGSSEKETSAQTETDKDGKKKIVKTSGKTSKEQSREEAAAEREAAIAEETLMEAEVEAERSLADEKVLDVEVIEEEKVETGSVSSGSGARQHTETQTETEVIETGGTGAATVSDGGLGELYIAVHGYPVGDLTKNEETVYRFLRTELGLNKAAASGVLSNMYFESSFSTVAIGDGGTSLGLCQWHAGRCRSLMGWCNAHNMDYRSIDGQLNYLKYELEGAYSGVLGYLYGCSDTADGAYHAGYYFCMYFESPDSVQTRSDARGTYAKTTYYPSDLERYLGSAAPAAKTPVISDTAVVPDTRTESSITAADGSVIVIRTQTNVLPGNTGSAGTAVDDGIIGQTGSAQTDEVLPVTAIETITAVLEENAAAAAEEKQTEEEPHRDIRLERVR